MDLGNLIVLCEKFQDLGWAVQEQLKQVCDNPDDGDFNVNALKLIVGFLDDANALGVDGADATLADVSRLIND